MSNNVRKRNKIVYFIRHGVAAHNLCVVNPVTGKQSHQNLADPSLADPILVSRGERQALEAGKKLFHNMKRQHQKYISGDGLNGDNSEVVVPVGLDQVFASPLTRCLQTAALMLQSFMQSMENDFEGQGASGPSPSLPLVVCNEDLRELYGKHFPDKRSRKSELEESWPTVLFDPNMTEEDSVWQPHSRETWHDINLRVDRFMNWLVSRDIDKCAEVEIASHSTSIVPCALVVSHGIWLECCLLRYCPQVLDMGKRRVYNCDLFCGTLWWEETKVDGQVDTESGIKYENICLEDVFLVE